MTVTGMPEWSLLVASGMIGATHCVGMCGPFALLIGTTATDWRSNLRRQLAYSAGRVFTYAVLGAFAGYVAARIAAALPTWTNLPAGLAMAAGFSLVWQGLKATGWVRRRGVGGGGCPGAAALRGLLAARGLLDAFLAGLFTGLLPCGLLYGMLAYAASCDGVVAGMAAMAAFGAGTVPALVAVGLGGSAVSVVGRRRMFTCAAWCLVATGIVSIVRGAAYVTLPGREPVGCPLCTTADDAATVGQSADDVRPVP